MQSFTWRLHSCCYCSFWQ